MIMTYEELRDKVFALSREELDELVRKDKINQQQERNALGMLAIIAAPAIAVAMVASNN